MTSGVGRQAGRLAAAIVAAGFALGWSGAASAEPVLAGSCASTLRGEEGLPLTVDLPAAVNAPGVADIALGAEVHAAVRLPVKESLDALGVSDAGVVASPLVQACELSRRAVNGLAAPVQEVLPSTGRPDKPARPDAPKPRPGEPGEPGDAAPVETEPAEPDPEETRPAEPAPAEPEPGEEPAASELAPAPSGPEPAGPGDEGAPLHIAAPEPRLPEPAAGSAPVAPAGGVSGPLAAEVRAPAAPVGPGPTLAEGGDRTEDTSRQPATVQALPAAHPHDRVPLVLAVVTLLVVIAALSRAWQLRKTA